MNIIEMIERGMLSEVEIEKDIGKEKLELFREGYRQQKEQLEQAMAALTSEGDAKEKVKNVMRHIDGHEAIGFVNKHLEVLHESGLVEEFFVDSFTRHNQNHRLHYDVIGEMLCVCRRQELQNAGDEIPPGDEFTLYRGCHSQDWIKGYSWTGSKKVAQWFIDRYDLDDPYLVSCVVKREDILFYTNARTEDEYVIDPSMIKDWEWQEVKSIPADKSVV